MAFEILTNNWDRGSQIRPAFVSPISAGFRSSITPAPGRVRPTGAESSASIDFGELIVEYQALFPDLLTGIGASRL